MNKIAFVIGHHKYAKGAYSKFFGQYEYDFYKQYEELLKEYGDVFYHNPLIPSYTLRQKYMTKRTKDYKLSVELHFNSYDTHAEGIEVLHHFNNRLTKQMAVDICNLYSNTPDVRINNRGNKPRWSKNQRGFGFIKHQKPHALLIEPFFGDNYLDCSKFDMKRLLNTIKKVTDLYI